MTTKIKEKRNIPEGWQEVRFEGVLDFERPDNYIVKSTNYTQDGKIPVLTANKSFVLGHTTESFGIYENTPAIIFDDFTTDSKYVDFPFKIKSSAIKILKSKDEQQANLKFLYEKMRLINFPRGNHKRYYISQYQKQKIALPSLKEQKKIVEILGTVDEDIAKTQEVIDATEKLKRGLMQQLFTRGIGHAKFKKTKLGEIPEGWKVVLLGRYVNIRSGDSPSGFDFKTGGEFPFYKVEDMNQNEKYLINTRYYFEFYNKTLMPKSMIVFPKRGAAIYTNKVRILYSDSYFDTNIMGLSVKNGLYNEYLYYLLYYIGLAQFADTTSVAQINNKHIEPLEIPLPDTEEQQKIAEILSAVDEKISVNKKLKEKLTQLKKGLMQDLLSGRVRTK